LFDLSVICIVISKTGWLQKGLPQYKIYLEGRPGARYLYKQARLAKFHQTECCTRIIDVVNRKPDVSE